jgi:hypothetical protein
MIDEPRQKRSRANYVSPPVAEAIIAWLDDVSSLPGEVRDRIEAIRDLLDSRLEGEK